MFICFTAQKIKFSIKSLFSECKYLLTLTTKTVYGKVIFSYVQLLTLEIIHLLSMFAKFSCSHVCVSADKKC